MNPRAHPGNPLSPPPSPPQPLPVWTLAVAGAALLAHGGCLRSVFYLDDWTHIVQDDSVIDGTWYDYRLRSLTYLVYYLTYRLAGLSAPAFHAGNLLLHVGVSLALLGFARDFLTDAAGLTPVRARRVGGWAALLFAVHPLCSEMTNYARANDIGLVSLFSLLAARAVLRWRRDDPLGWLDAALAAVSPRGAPPGQARRRWWLGAMLAALVAATFSKEVGLPIALVNVALVGFALPRVGGVAPLRAAHGRWRWLALAALAVAGAGLLAVAVGSQLAGPWYAAVTSLGNSQRLGWFLLTEARVFWMYGARVAWPVRLCSDHQIAWTRSALDGVAWVAASAQAAVCVGALAALCQRRRPAVRAAGALAALALVDIMHRVFNVTGELMVEYRMYPAMGPVCLLLAWGAAGGWLTERWKMPSAAVRAAMAAAVAACLVLSARRTLDWSSLEALTANITAQYPYNGRARQELQEADIRAGRWAAVVARQPDIRRALDGALAYNQSQNLRSYEPAYLTMTRVASEGSAALGLARQGRRREASAQIEWLRTAMNANRVTDHYFWAIFYYNDGLVHAAAGERDAALMDLRDAVSLAPDFNFLSRAQRRCEAGQPIP